MKKLKTYKQYEAKSLVITDEMLNEFVEKYSKQYNEFFINMFNNFRDTLIETIKEYADLNKYDESSYKFIEHLNSDMYECKNIVENGLYTLDVEDYMRNDTSLYKKYGDDDEKYNDAIYNLLIQENIRSFQTLRQK